MDPGGSVDDFAVGSSGRDTAYTFDFSTSGASFYSIESMADFANDLVSWNGQFVCSPRTTAAGT
jgi:hypothetical protein